MFDGIDGIMYQSCCDQKASQSSCSAFVDDEAEVRLFSHSSIKLDAVRVSCEAVNLLNAGHGIPFSVRGRSPSSVFRSPKLLFPLTVSQYGLSAKKRSKRVLNQ